MPFKHFSYRIQVILRIVLILSIGFAGVIIAVETSFWMVAFWLGLVVFLMILELIRFHERSKKALREFLLSVKQEDFSSLSTIDETDRELQDAYRQILNKFRYLRIQKETHYHYLQRVIEHVDTALICLDHNQDIQLINHSAKELLQVPAIKDLRALEKVDRELVSLIRTIGTGQREMIRLIRKGKILNLSVRATEFTLEKDSYKIVSLHDIKTELEEQEVDSWQKLVRILTHEIMNSTIPITNMVSFAREFLVDEDGNPKQIPGLNEEEISDLIESLTTAESRSKGLVKFVQKTKSLTRIPEPSFREVKLKDLINRVKELFKQELEALKIELTIDLKQPDLIIKADLELIEQVLINLIRNSIEALEHTREPMIELSAGQENKSQTIIRLRDNGKGIDPEHLEQIFVPFFSTRKEGSGIGLSLSRQIMKLHKGRIEVESEKGTGTCFSLVF
jgi:two-component system nitrogen regulation sensor histidine kinase NtrY